MIRVLLMDGQAKVRWGLRMPLAAELDMFVVVETGKAEEAFPSYCRPSASFDHARYRRQSVG